MSIFEESYLEHDSCKFHTFTYTESPKVNYRGVVIIVHGWSEHILMYKDTAKVLSSMGFHCFAYDQRECGKTKGKYTNSECYIDDLDFMVNCILEKKSKGQKVHLLGHSMGGAVVLDYLQKGKCRNNIAAVIASGPFIRHNPKTAPSMLVTLLLDIIAYIFPSFKYSEAKSLENYRKVSTNKEKQLEMFNDDLCIPSSSIRIIADMFHRGKRLLNSAPTYSTNARMLILQSQNDEIVSSLALKQFIEGLPIKCKKIVMFENSGHSLLLEKESTVKEAFAIIDDFLKDNTI